MKKIALIVAGGTGTRMQSSVPKQFLPLGNLPILMHAIKAFNTYDPSVEIRVALPELETEVWKNLCDQYQFKIAHSLARGGETRFHTVKMNLTDIPKPSLIAIHDGVRPMVHTSTIANCFKMAEEYGTAIPVVPVKESIRKTMEDDSIAEDRTLYRIVQTPQVFQSEILINAYSTEYQQSFTDDASVVEYAGFKIYTTGGNEENIKITTPVDLLIAEALLKESLG
jgi:2-C-methyl-D-erythritol 4-phosphate cytidylyltransferase